MPGRRIDLPSLRSPAAASSPHPHLARGLGPCLHLAAEAAELARSVAGQRLRMMDPAGAGNDEDRAERVELLRKANVRDLVVSSGVLTDKAEKLADQSPPAGERLSTPSIADAAAVLETMRAAVHSRTDHEAREAEIERRVQERLGKIEVGGVRARGCP